jgi:hypothetical protein
MKEIRVLSIHPMTESHRFEVRWTWWTWQFYRPNCASPLFRRLMFVPPRFTTYYRTQLKQRLVYVQGLVCRRQRGKFLAPVWMSDHLLERLNGVWERRWQYNEINNKLLISIMVNVQHEWKFFVWQIKQTTMKYYISYVVTPTWSIRGGLYVT